VLDLWGRSNRQWRGKETVDGVDRENVLNSSV